MNNGNKRRIGRGIGKEKTHENSGYRITGAHGLAQVLYTPGNWARDFASTQNMSPSQGGGGVHVPKIP